MPTQPTTLTPYVKLTASLAEAAANPETAPAVREFSLKLLHQFLNDVAEAAAADQQAQEKNAVINFLDSRHEAHPTSPVHKHKEQLFAEYKRTLSDVKRILDSGLELQAESLIHNHIDKILAKEPAPSPFQQQVIDAIKEPELAAAAVKKQL